MAALCWFCKKCKSIEHLALFPNAGHTNTVNHPPTVQEPAMNQPGRPDPHDYAHARRCAECLRRDALDDVWRGADAVLDRVFHSAGARLARSTRRLQARLAFRARRSA
jgi:hypothetical protein